MELEARESCKSVRTSKAGVLFGTQAIPFTPWSGKTDARDGNASHYVSPAFFFLLVRFRARRKGRQGGRYLFTFVVFFFLPERGFRSKIGFDCVSAVLRSRVTLASQKDAKADTMERAKIDLIQESNSPDSFSASSVFSVLSHKLSAPRSIRWEIFLMIQVHS